jgi:hypothetical protein
MTKGGIVLATTIVTAEAGPTRFFWMSPERRLPSLRGREIVLPILPEPALMFGRSDPEKQIRQINPHLFFPTSYDIAPMLSPVLGLPKPVFSGSIPLTHMIRCASAYVSVVSKSYTVFLLAILDSTRNMAVIGPFSSVVSDESMPNTRWRGQ